jgi:nucleoside-diphosphate-sugar epimerase
MVTPDKYNRILHALLGSDELVKKWWSSPNKAFGELTPNEMWDRDKDRVKKYLLAQLSGEYLCQFLEQAGQKVNVFRPFSGYGSDQDLSYPFPSFIKRAVDKDDPFKIWGDGFQTRDFIHIDDIVEAVNAAVTNDIQGPVNLGWGRPTNFNQLAELVCKPVGYKPELFHHLEAPIGVYYRVCDPNKMLSFYTPKITLEEGIDRAIKNLNNS